MEPAVLREQLIDLTRQIGPLVDRVKIVSGDPTKFETFSDDKLLIILGEFKQPIAAFDTDFGIGSLNTLGKLLTTPSFKNEGATIRVNHNKALGHISDIEFRDGNRSSMKFVTVIPRLMTSVPLTQIEWNVTIAPSKANIAEFSQLAGILADFPTFGVQIDGDKLFLTIGGADGSHSAKVLFGEDVAKPLESKHMATVGWTTKHLTTVCKLISGDSCEVKLSDKGLIMFKIETEHAVYHYLLRGKAV